MSLIIEMNCKCGYSADIEFHHGFELEDDWMCPDCDGVLVANYEFENLN